MGERNDVLDRVIREARLRMPDERDSTGLREILLGLAATEPRLVLHTAKRSGFDTKRLVAALSEWYPASFQSWPTGTAEALTAPARELIEQANTSQDPARRLAQALFTDAWQVCGSTGQMEEVDRTTWMLSTFALV